MLRSISKQSEGIHVVSSEEENEDGKDLQERKVFTARCYASAVLAMALCLSVRPSVCRCSTKTAKRRITQTTPHDRSGTLVFWCQRSPRNSTGVITYEGAKCR